MKYFDSTAVPTRRHVIRNAPIEILERLKYLAAKEHTTVDLQAIKALLLGLTELEAGRVAELPTIER